MGKASRAKRERKQELSAEAAAVQATIAGARAREPRRLPVFWIVVSVLVLAAGGTLFATRPDSSDDAAKQAGKQAPVYADVTATGELAQYRDGKDPAVGEPLPAVRGTGMNGRPLRVSDEAGAQVVIVMAHWCPHCNREIPRIVEWVNDGNLPSDVQLRGISTSVQSGSPNYPPAEWLVQQDWNWPTLVDDELGTGAAALGGDGFPFIVFVDADGIVQERFSGEMPIDDFAAAVRKLSTSQESD